MLQPRRRDFSRSSQGLPDLQSALHAPQHCGQQGLRPSAPDWQNTLLPRDPSWALPNPHQRPATAAPSASRYTAEQSLQWSDSSHAYQHSREAAAPAGMCKRHPIFSRQQIPAGPTSCAFRDDRAASLHPDHLPCGGSLPLQGYQHDIGARGTTWSPSNAAPSAARSRPRTAQHTHDGRGNRVLRMQQPVCQLQGDYTAGMLYSQQAAQHVFPQPFSERLCVHTDEPAHQHAYSWQQPWCEQCHAPGHPGGCFDWAEYSRAAHGEPTSLLHQAEGGEFTQKAPTAVYDVVQPSGLAHMRRRDSQHPNVQAPDGGSIAAMEKVLADYKALRMQISDAEAQLSVLQRGSINQWQEDVCWSQPSCYQHRADSSVGYKPLTRDRDEVKACGDDQAHCRELTSTLRALKAAAARQRPAVEAVASQLRNTLSRAHCTSPEEATS